MKTSARIVIACVALSALACSSGCMSNAQLKKIPTIELEGWKHTDNLGPWQSSIGVDKVTKNPDGTFTVLNYEGAATFMGYGVKDEIKTLKITPTPTATKAKPAPIAPAEHATTPAPTEKP